MDSLHKEPHRDECNLAIVEIKNAKEKMVAGDKRMKNIFNYNKQE